MYINSGYLNHSLRDFMDKSKPLVVGSCGTYRLYTRTKLPTYRPKGRLDFQLIYIASGKAYFYFEEGKETIVPAGNMVLYRPKEFQKYVYYGEDQTEVYWVHFTGNQVKTLLKEHSIPQKEHLIHTGISSEYQQLFQRMITELQLCKPHFEELLVTQLMQLFILISRLDSDKKDGTPNVQIMNDMEQAAAYFNEYYPTNISIEDYAHAKHMSTSWFIRNFKKYHGITPLNYIVKLRIANAQSLLETTSYNVTEIANIVGYDNPLYFSRLFHKQVGMSPKQYRKHLLS